MPSIFSYFKDVCLDEIKSKDIVLVFGSFLQRETPELVRDLLVLDPSFIHISPMSYYGFGYKQEQINCEVGSEEAVFALLCKEFSKNKFLEEEIKEYLNNLDDGYLSAESNVGEEEIEKIVKDVISSDKCWIVIGREIVTHPRFFNILRFLNLLKKLHNIEIISNVFVNKTEYNNAIPEDVELLSSFDGTMAFVSKALTDNEKFQIIASKQFAIAAKISNSLYVDIEINKLKEEREFVLDPRMKGTIALVPQESINQDKYPFVKVKITPKEIL